MQLVRMALNFIAICISVMTTNPVSLHAEPSGIVLKCTSTSLEISAQGSTDVYPSEIESIAELSLMAKTACLEFISRPMYDDELIPSKKCFELEVYDEKFVVRTQKFEDIGAGRSIEKSPFVIFRHTGKYHFFSIESHFNGDYAKRTDQYGICEKTGEFETKKKF